MIDRFLHGIACMLVDPVEYRSITVTMPGDMDPFDRHYRFAIHLDAELRLAAYGCCSGGGTLYTNVDFDAEEPSEDELAFTVLDIDATDVEGARALLRLHLPELGAPQDTRILLRDHADRFDGTDWHLGEPTEEPPHGHSTPEG